jgi:thiol-disulfide isomerase/thioredoxin
MLSFFLSGCVIEVGGGSGSDPAVETDVFLREPNCKNFKSQRYDVGEKLGERATLLMFYTGWCPACHTEIPQLVEWKLKYGRNLEIITVMMEDYAGNRSHKYLSIGACTEQDQFGGDIHYDIIDDPTLFGKLGGQYIPLNVLLTPDGEIYNIIEGAYLKTIELQIRGLMVDTAPEEEK